jgi:hypothetical protein
MASESEGGGVVNWCSVWYDVCADGRASEVRTCRSSLLLRVALLVSDFFLNIASLPATATNALAVEAQPWQQ